MLIAWIPFTLSCHSSLLTTTLGKSSRWHPVLSKKLEKLQKIPHFEMENSHYQNCTSVLPLMYNSMMTN